jgi:bacterioferritin (cytochrome b1)
MDRQSESLNRLLRCELTAVHQQFIHVLTLRERGREETAARIMKTDTVDFPVAMRIIDFLIETGAPLALASEAFAPGQDHRSILAAEQTMEARLRAALDAADCADERAVALLATAEAPRDAYAAWLAAQLGDSDPDPAPAAPRFPETAGLVAHLAVLIEQAMAHAFLHWHRGTRDHADAAWATSGGAMMQMTAFVELFAAHRATPAPGDMPALRIADDPADAFDCDRRLAADCAEEAAGAAAACREPALAALCRSIADYSRRLSVWSPEAPHPAAATNPAAFASFEATLDRFVRV